MTKIHPSHVQNEENPLWHQRTWRLFVWLFLSWLLCRAQLGVWCCACEVVWVSADHSSGYLESSLWFLLKGYFDWGSLFSPWCQWAVGRVIPVPQYLYPLYLYSSVPMFPSTYNMSFCDKIIDCNRFFSICFNIYLKEDKHLHWLTLSTLGKHRFWWTWLWLLR